MWHHIERVLGPVFRQASHLDRQGWIIIFAGALFVGYLCLKGFGSRTKY